MKTNRNNRNNGTAGVVEKQQKKSYAVKMAVTFLMLGLMAIVSPFTANAARERYVLEFDDAHIRASQGAPATIFLKKAFREQYPWVELADMDLRKVVLVAKSKMGRGGAQLRVGEWFTDTYEVAGRPVDFRDRRKITFDEVHFYNPSGSSHGPWQIDLQGNFIVRKVVLELNNYRWKHHYYGRKPHHKKDGFDTRYYSRR